MPPSSPYKTLSNIRSAIISDAKESTDSTLVAQIDRWINEGIEQVTLRKKRDWLDTQFTVQVNAAVQADCTVTLNSPTVTFATGTTFPSGVELQFNNPGFNEIYNVASSTLNVVTLDKPYLGASNTAASGIVYQSSVILDSTIRSVYQGYHQFDNRPLVDLGPQQMRTVQEQGAVTLNYARFMSIFGQDSDGARRLQLYPYPLNAYTVYLDTNTFAPMLVLDTDEPSIPIQYRQILYFYGAYKLWMYQRNESQAQSALANFNAMLARLDGETRAELDFPQISVSYFRPKSLRNFLPKFDPAMRDTD